MKNPRIPMSSGLVRNAYAVVVVLVGTNEPNRKDISTNRKKNTKPNSTPFASALNTGVLSAIVPILADNI